MNKNGLNLPTHFAEEPNKLSHIFDSGEYLNAEQAIKFKLIDDIWEGNNE